jgi:hypothetical protein
MHRVVIVGCGFAGLFAAVALRSAEVEVVGGRGRRKRTITEQQVLARARVLAKQ